MPSAQRTREFVRLLTQNERKVYSFILSMVPNLADADEILQETNVRLWEQFDKFEPGTDFAAWARTIARYMVMAFRTRTGRERVHFSDTFLRVVADEMAAIEPEMDQQREALDACLKTLPTHSRQLIDLVYTGGLSMKDIAGRIGKSVAATYKATARVRTALYHCIENRLNAGGHA